MPSLSLDSHRLLFFSYQLLETFIIFPLDENIFSHIFFVELLDFLLLQKLVSRLDVAEVYSEL